MASASRAFSNVRVQDRQGRHLGAIGLGIDVRELSRELAVTHQRRGAQVRLVAADGRVQRCRGGGAG